MSVVDGARRAALALMVDACTINAPDVPGVLNETTGQYTPTPGAQRYTGACRIRPAATQDIAADAAERVVMQRTYVVSVPMSVTTAVTDDVVRVTASATDPALAGTRMRVVGRAKGSHLSARRLVCEEVTS